MFKFEKQKGQVSRLLLVLAIIVLVAVVITYLVLKMAEKPKKPAPEIPEIPMPVYETKLGDIRFVFESALDRGKVLKVSEIKREDYNYGYEKDYQISNPGAKFIQVTIGAQNAGTQNTEEGAWDIENIIDSKGRQFDPLEDYSVESWLPENNGCSALLKPAFDPTPCTKIYEVSKESAGLKIRVMSGKENRASNLSADKADTALIDLIVK